MKSFLVSLCFLAAFCQISLGGDEDSSSQEDGPNNALKELENNVSSLWTYISGVRQKVEHDLHQLHKHQMEVSNKLNSMFGIELEQSDMHMLHMDQGEHQHPSNGEHDHKEHHDDEHHYEHHHVDDHSHGHGDHADHHDEHHDDHHGEHHGEHHGDHHDEHHDEHHGRDRHDERHGRDHHDDHHDEHHGRDHHDEHHHGRDHQDEHHGEDHHDEAHHGDDHHDDHHSHHSEEHHGNGHADDATHTSHDHPSESSDGSQVPHSHHRHEHDDSGDSHESGTHSDSDHHKHDGHDNSHQQSDHSADHESNDTTHTTESHHQQHHHHESHRGHHHHQEESHHHHHHHDHHHGHHTSHKHSSKYDFAVCNVEPNSAIPPENRQNITGRINLWQKKNGTTLHIHIKIKGFNMDQQHGDHSEHQPGEGHPPAEHLHGIHVHQEGDLSNGCQSTGPHFNPTGVQHGGPSSPVRHVGDLGNIECDQHGITNVVITDEIASLHGEDSIIGKAIVIHERRDDLGTNPDNPDSLSSGDAGSRIACCVITKVTRLSMGGHSHGHHH